MGQLLDAIKKRDTMFGVIAATPSQLSELAKSYLAAGQEQDALDFFVKAGDKEALKSMAKRASESGDVFLLLQVWRHIENHDLDLLRAASLKCESEGRFRYALKGYERLEDQAAQSRIQERIMKDPDVVAEQAAKVFIPKSEETDLEE